MEICFYIKSNESSPIIDFIEKQDKRTKAKILGCLESIELLGIESNRVQFRQIEGKLWEIKIRTVNVSFRLFYVQLKLTLVVLHGYKKQSQKAPDKEIQIEF